MLIIATSELQNYTQTRESSLGEEAAAILQSGGKAALRDWLQNDAQIPGDVRIYILDESSRDILGRELPAEFSDFIKRSVIGKQGNPDSNYQPVRLAPQLIAPDGTRYAFLVLPTDITVWGSPATVLSLVVVALLVIATVAWLIARTLSSPISELQLAVRELALGHTDARVPDSISARKDELGTLAADFNAMADQLTELISGREALMREMSHELRSPLARLQAALALAVEKGSLPVEERERLDYEIARMNRVIGEILRYSRMDTMTATRKRLVRIDRLLEKLVQDEEIEASTHNCQLTLRSQPGLEVIGDEELLRSCFENILRNAIRYAPAGSVVEIQAGQHGDISVSILDRGPGVAAEHLEQIFEPYYRVARGAHHPDSTGLGLAIVQRIARHHGGTVAAKQREGGGLSVTVTLPAAESD